jgi:hypothetical protein
MTSATRQPDTTDGQKTVSALQAGDDPAPHIRCEIQDLSRPFQKAWVGR